FGRLRFATYFQLFSSVVFHFAYFVREVKNNAEPPPPMSVFSSLSQSNKIAYVHSLLALSLLRGFSPRSRFVKPQKQCRGHPGRFDVNSRYMLSERCFCTISTKVDPIFCIGILSCGKFTKTLEIPWKIWYNKDNAISLTG
ncbi:MAG: hypothetical protein K2J80_12225, partial [Oscillospiraceae bacterium]|nr:hypothetical protein [Oscillospiraceae bacterium]